MLKAPIRKISSILGYSESMRAQENAEKIGLKFEKQTPGYLNLCVRSGNQLISSGHVSSLKGKLGADWTTQEGYAAARECAAKILNSVWNTHGTLNGLRVIKVLGCVNSAPEFVEQHLVINGASDLLHEVFGKTGDGYHARSALGFASLPTGAAVEVEAVFEIQG
jgi:enamine deaminase RidA (YjgF/YER057c/UK114 family)